MSQLVDKLGKAAWYAQQWVVHGRPDVILMFFGGLGDHLMCTAVARELKTRGARKIWINSDYPALFAGNPDIDHVLPVDMRSYGYFNRIGMQRTEVRYPPRIEELDAAIPTNGHVIATMCQSVGMTGHITLRPYMHLKTAERAQGRVKDRQIVIQSTGMGATRGMRNKEWYPERFQQVVHKLKDKFNFVQIGLASDPPLDGAVDLRGKTTPRESASILSNSLLFVGLEGFLVHLSRAVDCRAVVVLGGRTLPHQFGYSCNQNLATDLPCSNCWKWNTCEYDRKCMREISTDRVIDAIEHGAGQFGSPLVEDTAEIGRAVKIPLPVLHAALNL